MVTILKSTKKLRSINSQRVKGAEVFLPFPLTQKSQKFIACLQGPVTAIRQTSRLGMPFADNLPGWSIMKRSTIEKLPR